MESTLLFAPLVGAFIAGFGWRLTGQAAVQWIAASLMLLSAILAGVIYLTLVGSAVDVQILRFIESGTFSSDWAIRLDRLSVTMMLLVTSVGTIVQGYAIFYPGPEGSFKPTEPAQARLSAYLSILCFAMLVLASAGNLIQFAAGWGGVGMATYLLIGHYYKKPDAHVAALRSAVVGRLGDFGLICAITALFLVTDSVRFDDIFAVVPDLFGDSSSFMGAEVSTISLIASCLALAALAGSAQFLFHGWLIGASEAPIPAAALIQGAGSSAAGVFLLCRMAPFLSAADGVITFITIMGALTAAFAATLSIVEKDIKRVIACLSLAQLGFMFVAAGVGSVSVAVSMLMLHGFVIALLLLGAGSVVQAMQHARNMMKYGGLRRRLPVTFVAMVAGTVVLTGVGLPLTSPGFGLRAVVIAEVWSAGELYGVWLLLVSAGLTAFAAWRMVFLTFAGTPRGDKHHCESVRESRALTLVPLGVLGIAVVVSGWSYVDPDQDDLPLWVLVYPFLSMLLGFLAAGMLYLWKTDIPARWAEARRPLYRFLRHGWHIDEICQVALVTFARKVGDFISDRVDIGAIERLPGRIAHGMAPREGQDRFGTLTAYAVAGGIGLGVMVIWAIAMGGGAP